MGLVSISIYRRHAANVVQCAPGSRATVRFQPRTAYPNGLILLEIDHGLGIGRATSSSSNAHLLRDAGALSQASRRADCLLFGQTFGVPGGEEGCQGWPGHDPVGVRFASYMPHRDRSGCAFA
jgi:hypothetical protein